MATLTDPEVQKLLSEPNHAVISTLNQDGSVHSAVAWISAEDGIVAVNSARGRKWPTNLERDPRVNIVVYEQDNPYNYVEIRGRANATTEGADEHINALSKKYVCQDEFQGGKPGEKRIKFMIEPDHVRHQKQD
jgi:PPOX class probable F420-dependent enzyme